MPCDSLCLHERRGGGKCSVSVDRSYDFLAAVQYRPCCDPGPLPIWEICRPLERSGSKGLGTGARAVYRFPSTPQLISRRLRFLLSLTAELRQCDRSRTSPSRCPSCAHAFNRQIIPLHYSHFPRPLVLSNRVRPERKSLVFLFSSAAAASCL